MGIRRIGLDKMVENTAVTAGVSQEQARKVIGAFIAELKLAFCRGDTVAIREFGVFKTSHHPAHTGHSPQTGEPMTVQAYDTVTFKVSKKFRNTLNG